IERQHPRGLPMVRWAPEGRKIFTLGGGGELARWLDIDSEAMQSAGLRGVGGEGVSLDFTTDGRRIMVGYEAAEKAFGVRIFDRIDLASVATFRAFTGGRWLGYRPDGRCAASPGTAVSVVPMFTIRGERIERTARSCVDDLFGP
ncbi:MAG: hypothetical protein AAF449_10700, partial [Myxococcota bacterium]